MKLILERGATKEQMDQLNEKLSHLPVRKKLDTKKYCGVVKLKEDPRLIQKRAKE